MYIFKSYFWKFIIFYRVLTIHLRGKIISSTQKDVFRIFILKKRQREDIFGDEDRLVNF